MKNKLIRNIVVMLILSSVPGTVSVSLAGVGASSIKGHIDLGGKSAVLGTVVTIINVDNGSQINVETNENGNYVFASLRPGHYRLQIGDSDFQSDAVSVKVGQSKTLNLSDSSVENESTDENVITIVNSYQAFDITSEVGTNVSIEQIERLPQVNRNFLSFADQAPGVSLSVSQADGSVSLHSGSQAASAINVFVDGIGQKDYVLSSGITGQDSSRGNPFPQAAISEYRIISSNYKAEFDQVSSAAITAVTKSGSNKFKGGVFYDFTDSNLREKTPNEIANGDKIADSKQEQFGFWSSGPIIEDKLHYFITYERKQNNDLRDVNLNSRIDLLDNYPQSLQEQIAQNIGPTTVSFEEDLIFAKLDWNIKDNQDLSISLKYRDEVEVTGVGGINTPEYGTDKENNDLRLTVMHQYWGAGWSNDLSFSYEDVIWMPHARSTGFGSKYQIGSTDHISGDIINLGAGPDFQKKGQKGWSIKDDITFTDIVWNGEHSIKMGFNFKFIELSSIEKNPSNPQVYYVLDATDVAADDTTTTLVPVPYKMEYGQALSGIGNGAAISENTQIGLYIQDDWYVNERLEFNLGIRWSYEDSPLYTDYKTPSDINLAVSEWTNLNNANYNINNYISTGKNRKSDDGSWEPRLGFSYFLTENSKHLLFGGIGRSYDRNRFDFLQLETTKGTFPKRTVYFSGDHTQICNDPCIAFEPQFLTQGGLSNLQAVGGSREVYMLDNDLEKPYSDQFSLGIRSIYDEFETEFGYTRVEAKNGFMFQLGNRRVDGTFFADGTTWGAPWGDDIPGADLSHLILGTNGLESERDSFHMKITKHHRNDSDWGGAITYTYSDANENRQFGETFSLDYPSIGDFGTNASAGVSDHVIVANFTYDLPWEIKFATKITLKSAAPYYGVDCLAGWSDCKFSQVYQQENKFILADWAYRQVDISISKNINISDTGGIYIRLDVLNAFNTENYGVSDTWFGAPNEPNADLGNHYGNIVGPTRTLKLSAGYNF